jgi:PAS domain-containing protein
MSVRSDTSEASLLVAAFDAMALPVLLHDYDRVLFANAAAGQILGAATGADLAGMTLDTFVVPELAAVTRERRAYLLRNGVVFADLPIKMRTLDGREIRLTIDARPFSFDGRSIGMATLKALEADE